MFKHNLESEFYFKTFLNCFLLSFLAGSVNAGGFMACGRFVTHVTGFATIVGIDLARSEWQAALGILTVPVYFLLGAMLSAALVDRRIIAGRQAGYSIVMGLITLCLLIVAVGGHLGVFGHFGGEVNLKQDYSLLALLCGASGLQNATITTFTGAVVRTTHLTGITTDLGIGIVRLLSPMSNPKQRVREVRANWLRIITILAFTLGSLIGAVLFLKMSYLGFLLPSAIAIYAMVVSSIDERKPPTIAPDELESNEV